MEVGVKNNSEQNSWNPGALRILVARERFELSSAAPEAAMFDHCTTGLCLME
jgi:hypothetical protein